MVDELHAIVMDGVMVTVLGQPSKWVIARSLQTMKSGTRDETRNTYPRSTVPLWDSPPLAPPPLHSPAVAVYEAEWRAGNLVPFKVR